MGKHWTGSQNKRIDQQAKIAQKMSEHCVFSPSGQFLDIFRTFSRHFSDILSTFPFSGVSNDLPVAKFRICWNLEICRKNWRFGDVVTDRVRTPTFRPRKKSTNPNFWVRIFSGGVGVFHAKGWGPKSSVCPSKPGKWNFFGGISRDFAGISRGCPKSLRTKSLCSIIPARGKTRKKKTVSFFHWTPPQVPLVSGADIRAILEPLSSKKNKPMPICTPSCETPKGRTYLQRGKGGAHPGCLGARRERSSEDGKKEQFV